MSSPKTTSILNHPGEAALPPNHTTSSAPPVRKDNTPIPLRPNSRKFVMDAYKKIADKHALLFKLLADS